MLFLEGHGFLIQVDNESTGKHEGHYLNIVDDDMAQVDHGAVVVEPFEDTVNFLNFLEVEASNGVYCRNISGEFCIKRTQHYIDAHTPGEEPDDDAEHEHEDAWGYSGESIHYAFGWVEEFEVGKVLEEAEGIEEAADSQSYCPDRV